MSEITALLFERVNAAFLKTVMPNMRDNPNQPVNQVLNALRVSLPEFDITTTNRVAAFIGQIAHESGELRYLTELATGDAYEGRQDLGNNQPGDGRRYKGRGFIQLTGRANYQAYQDERAGPRFNANVVANPNLVATPAMGMDVSAWYWDKRKLNRYADEWDLETITRRINGGLNGFDRRVQYCTIARDFLTRSS